mgnify:CR=1 FL=1
MSSKYSQISAMLAITKGSLKAILRSPSAVVFSIAFPLIFILVFGFIGGSNGKTSVKIAIDPHSDTTSPVYTALTNINSIKIVKGSPDTLQQELEKGRITASIFIAKTGLVSPAYNIKITSSGAVMPQNIQLLQSVLSGVIAGKESIRLDIQLLRCVAVLAVVVNHLDWDLLPLNGGFRGVDVFFCFRTIQKLLVNDRRKPSGCGSVPSQQKQASFCV